MTPERIEEIFLRKNAGRHVVALTYQLKRDGKASTHQASCFVVELAGCWFLMTAGHVVKGETGIEQAIAAGFRLDKIRLIDVFAGKRDDILPIAFDPSDWVAIDDAEHGIDIAALPLRPLFRSGLEVAGVSPIEMRAISHAQFNTKAQHVLVGVPNESFKSVGSEGEMKLLMVTLTAYDGTLDIPARGDSILAKMGKNPDDEPHKVGDIAGMSGCPVFKIVIEAGQPITYGLVGIQSAWYKAHRIIRFCPVHRFAEVLERCMHIHLQQHATCR